MSLALLVVTSLLEVSNPPLNCGAERAIAAARDHARRIRTTRGAIDTYRVLGPIAWRQLVAAFPEYGEFEAQHALAGDRLFFLVGVSPRRRPLPQRRNPSAPPVFIVGGGIEVWVDAGTCNVIASLEGV